MSSNLKRIKKNGGVEALGKRVKTPGTVDVGIIDAGRHASGDATVAEIGFFNEFGTSRIPERSFMRSTVQEKKKDIVTMQKKLLKQIVAGTMEVKTGLGLLGEFMTDKIRRKIVSISSPPNTPATIARKGSSNPLIDTGQLKNSITYKVNL